MKIEVRHHPDWRMRHVLHPPPVIEAKPFTRVPKELDLSERPSAWARRQARGPVGAFLEGPSFDRDGNLWLVDIAHGRVFRVGPAGGWGRGRAVRRPAERARDPPRRPGLHRRFREGDHGAGPDEREDRALPRPGPLPGLQGLQRPLLRVERRPLLHRPGPHRPARPDRPGVVSPGCGRPPRMPDRHRPGAPQRARHGPRRVDALHRGDPCERGLADALRSGGTAVQGRPLRPAPRRERRPGRDGRWTRPATSRWSSTEPAGRGC